MKDALTFFGGNVTAVFWYSLLDNSWEQEQSNPQSFGLFRNETTRGLHLGLYRILFRQT
jgi:hypothetical protein